MPSTLFGSLPRLTKSAFLAARQINKIPTEISDDDALAQGLITPAMIELIMQIVQEIIQGCLDNNAGMAWRRVRGYLDSNKLMDRLGDQIRFNWMIDRWMNRLGVARDRGDVVFFREAIVQTAAALKQDDFNALQTEVLWLTI